MHKPVIDWPSVFIQGPGGLDMLEELQAAPRRTVGTKQTVRAVERGQVAFVYVARDADAEIVRHLISLCRQRGIPLREVDSMDALGRWCGVEVAAAAAGILAAAAPAGAAVKKR